MILFTSFQHQFNSDDFSLNGERLAYFSGGGPKVETRIGDTTTTRPTAEKTKEEIKALKSQIETGEKNLQKLIDDYNAKYGKGGAKVYERPLAIKANNPKAAIAKINALLDAKWSISGVEYTLRMAYPSTGRREQSTTLAQLIQKLEAHQKRIEKKQSLEGKVFEGYAHSIVHRSKRAEQMKQVRLEFQKNPAYRAMEADYDAVFSNIMRRDPRFKGLYQRLDQRGTGEVMDPNKERESKQLFFSILAQETNNFKDFMFPGMGQDWEKNRQKYPYIYEQWLKYKGGNIRQKIDRQKHLVNEASSQLGIKPENVASHLSGQINNLNAQLKRMGGYPDTYLIVDPFKDIPGKSTPVEYYDALRKAISSFNNNLALVQRRLEKDHSGQQSAIGMIREWRNKKLPQFANLAKLKYRHVYAEASLKLINKSFTKENLKKDLNQRKMIEFAMMRFHKAMLVVDAPFGKEGGSFHQNLHPAVRRMMISLVYKQGVSYIDRNGKYQSKVADQYKWLLGIIAQSPYFNRSSKEKFLDPEQREFLMVASYANFALFRMKYLREHIVGGLEQLRSDIQKRNDLKGNPAKATELKQYEKKVVEGVKRMNRLLAYARLSKPITDNDPGHLNTVISTEIKRVALWNKFVSDTSTLLRSPNPNRQALRDYITDIKQGRVLNGAPAANKKLVEQMGDYLQKVDLTYNSLDFNERSQKSYLEQMGISPKAAYEAYKVYIGRHGQEMRIDNWENLRQTKEGIQKLTDMFQAILPAYSGKESFLKVFATLQGVNPLTTKPALRNSQAVAFNVFNLLKIELKHREKIEVAAKAGNLNAYEKLHGMTFGDRVTDYAKGVMNMLIGPGQSIANRAAGAALLIAAFKLAKKAYRGEGKSGKLLRVVFMAAAAELALKHVTGEGLTDKMRLTGVADALEGTHEAVLMHRMEKSEVDMTKTEHAATLIEIRPQRMDKLMQWYEATDDGGNAVVAKDPNARIPSGIDIDNIVRGSATKNKESRARFLLKQTMKNFFGYVGGKAGANKGADVGKAIIKERWLSAAQGKEYDPRKFKVATHGIPPGLAEEIRNNPSRMNWQMVMQNEITAADVERVKKSRPLAMLKDYIRKQSYDLYQWTKNDILNKTGVMAKEFWAEVDTNYAPKIQKWLINMGEAGATKLRYTAKSVELWYKGNKHELRRAWDNTWEFVGEGIKLPFNILFAGHNYMTQFGLTTIRQTREILKSKQLTVLKNGEALNTNHVLNADVLVALNAGTLNGQPFTVENFKDRKRNPEYSHFGEYQIPFMLALRNGPPSTTVPREYISQPPRAGASNAEVLAGMRPGISFLVTATTPQISGVQGQETPAHQYRKMEIKAYNQALMYYYDKYQDQGVTLSIVKRLMYPIHVTSREFNNGRPQELYTFWRMPIPGSAEYRLKVLGRWPDYMDPNRHKHRPAFMIDPKKHPIDNLITAYGGRHPTLRKAAGTGTMLASQWVRLVMATLEGMGTVAYGVARGGLKFNRGQIEWIKDVTKRDDDVLQKIDELSTSAANTSSAHSKFYKDPVNSRLYREALEYSRRHRKPIDLRMKYDVQGNPTPRVWKTVTVDTQKHVQRGAQWFRIYKTYKYPASLKMPNEPVISTRRVRP